MRNSLFVIICSTYLGKDVFSECLDLVYIVGHSVFQSHFLVYFYLAGLSL